ncbi:MAG: respiratory nitrate reductase subunit gamma [Methylohalobius sp.]
MNDFNFWLFCIYPYVALTVLGAGSSQLLRRRQLIFGSVLFHTGVLIVFLGHFVGLLTSIRIFHWMGIEASTKQTMAIVVGGIAGSISLAGATGPHAVGTGVLPLAPWLSDRAQQTGSPLRG